MSGKQTFIADTYAAEAFASGAWRGVDILAAADACCSRADIEMVYGATNVEQWADLDNDESVTKIANRIMRAILIACGTINDAARVLHYRLPLRTAGGVTPTTVVNLCATMAGIWLYEARGLQDLNPQTKVFHHRLAFKRRESRILMENLRIGRRRLDAM